MPGLSVKSSTLVTTGKPYPASVAQLAAKIRGTQPDVSAALLLLQKSTEDLHRAMRNDTSAVQEIIVTDAAGNIVVRLGDLPTADGRIFYGAQTRALYVGGPGNPEDAPLWADANGNLFIGGNGSISVVDPYNHSAAWLGSAFDTLPVTGAVNNGAGLIRLTVIGHTLLTGDVARVLNVGGVPNAAGIRTVTKIDADHIDLQLSVWDGLFTAGGTVDRLLHVTGAVNNGAGLIRLTITAHGYESGDTVNVLLVGGVPNATGQWIVSVINANELDLRFSVWAGAYVSGGLSLRYAAGGNFQNIAIGTSFWNYNLRAFPDGTLKIKDALITLTGSGGGSATITLDPAMGTITVQANAPGVLRTVINGGGINVGSITPHDPGLFINNGVISLYHDVDGIVVTGPAVTILPEEIVLTDALGNLTVLLDAVTGQVMLDGGAAPAKQQFLLKANALGALGLLSAAADNQLVLFDVEWTGSTWVARNTSVCLMQEHVGRLDFIGSTGNTPGGVAALNNLMGLDLANGRLGVGGNVVPNYALDATGDVNATGVHRVNGTQVVGARLGAIGAPSGGATIDANARAVIVSLIAAMHNHGLIA